MITHPFLNSNGGLVKPPLKFGHWWVIRFNKMISVITFPDANSLSLSWQKRIRVKALVVVYAVLSKPYLKHDDVIKWKHFPRNWPFVRGIHRSPVNSPHKGQWRGVLMFSLICVWINGWVNNHETGDLRHYRAHYDVTVMSRYQTDEIDPYFCPCTHHSNENTVRFKFNDRYHEIINRTLTLTTVGIQMHWQLMGNFYFKS